jgi:DNA-binding transcriptional regulator WhiA
MGLLKYPKKSHRKIISFPRNSAALAEFMGIEFGDGGINNDWQVVISLNSIYDLEYAQYIIRLLSELFVIRVATRKRPGQNTLVLVCSSTSLVEFLRQKGAVLGNKIIQKIDIPEWILKTPSYTKAFVRGLVDTDGCLFIHNHFIKNTRYKNIGFCFTSSSTNLINSVAQILKKYNIEPHITDKGRRIYLYSKKSVEKYLQIFGSSNPRITKKYQEWRGAGVAYQVRLESV